MRKCVVIVGKTGASRTTMLEHLTRETLCMRPSRIIKCEDVAEIAPLQLGREKTNCQVLKSPADNDKIIIFLRQWAKNFGKE